MSAPPPSSVGRTAAGLVPVVLLARGVALLVPVAVAALLGVTDVTDAFFYAWALPAALLVVAGNSVATAATPELAKVRAERPETLGAAIGGLATGVAVAGLVATAVGSGVLWALLPSVTDFDAEGRSLAWRFLLLLAPYVAAMGARVALRAGAEVDGAFVSAAAGPLSRGLFTLIVLLLGHRALGAWVLPVAFDVGAMVEVAWLVVALRRRGVTVWPSLRLDPALVAAGAGVFPLLAGEALVAVNVMVDKGFAAMLPQGSVSWLEYADLARLIPQTLFESTLLPVAFATWATLAAQNDRGALSAEIDRVLRTAAAIAAPVLAGLWLGRHAAVAALFERGAFGADDTAAAAAVLGWYLPGLWMMLLGASAMRAMVVLRRYRTILWLGVLSAVLNIVLDAALSVTMGLPGLALASTVVWWVVPAAYLWSLRDVWSPDASDWAPVLGLSLASVVLTAALWGVLPVPTSVLDPMLWAASLPFFGLLALAVRTSQSRTA